MLKAITFDFWQTLYADSEENWRKRQAIRTKKCHAYLESRGYACGLDNVGFGLEEAYNLVNTRWHQHKGISVKRCMIRFAEVLQIQLEETDLDHLVACLGAAFLESPPIRIAKRQTCRFPVERNLPTRNYLRLRTHPREFRAAIDGPRGYSTIFHRFYVF